MISFELSGQIASKANSRRWTKHGFIKSAPALAWERSARLQLIAVRQRLRAEGIPLLTGPVRVEADVYYSSWRPDLDASLLYDVMQGTIYLNDRQVVEQSIRRFVDRQRPRVEVRVYPADRPDFPRQAGPKVSPVAWP